CIGEDLGNWKGLRGRGSGHVNQRCDCNRRGGSHHFVLHRFRFCRTWSCSRPILGQRPSSTNGILGFSLPECETRTIHPPARNCGPYGDRLTKRSNAKVRYIASPTSDIAVFAVGGARLDRSHDVPELSLAGEKHCRQSRKACSCKLWSP